MCLSQFELLLSKYHRLVGLYNIQFFLTLPESVKFYIQMTVESILGEGPLPRQWTADGSPVSSRGGKRKL